MKSSVETTDRPAGGPDRPHDRDSVFSVLGVGLTSLLATLTVIFIAVRIFSLEAMLPAMEGYPSLHTGIETFVIVVCIMVFAVGWNTPKGECDKSTLVLSSAFLAVGLLDVAHTLAFPGMPDFITPNNPEKAINFWMSARGLAALALLAAALLPSRPPASALTRYWLLAIALGTTALVYWLVLFHQDTLPATFIPGEGLTPLKIGVEYFIIAIYGLAAAGFYFRLRTHGPKHLRQLFVATCIAALGEFFFTFFADITDVYNQLGHVYKVIAHFLIYKALFVRGMVEPYRRLSQSQRALQESEERLSGIVQSAMHAIIMVDEDMNIVLFNPAAENIFGYPSADIIGARLDRLIPERFRSAHSQSMKAFCASNTAVRRMKEKGIITGLRADGEEFPAEASISHLTLNGKKLYTVILADVTEIVEAEKYLRIFAQVFETSQEGIFITDASNHIISVNPAFTHITGYTRDEVTGKSPNILKSGVQDDAFYRTMWASIIENGRWQGEIWDRHKSGRLYCEWLSISTIKNQRREIAYHTAIFSDITVRKRAEVEHAQLAAIVENSNDAIFSRAFDGTILSWNAGAERMLGYTAAEVIGKPVAVTLPPGRPPNLARNNEKVLRGEVVARESDRMTKDGRVINVLTSHSPIRDYAGNIVGVSVILQDISALKQAEEVRAQLATIVESSQDAIVGRALDGTITSWNAGAERIFGYTKTEAVGRHITMLIPPERRDAFEAHQKLLRDGRVLPPFESIQLAKDGRRIPVSVSVSRIRDARGRVTGVSIIVHDITARKKAEEAYAWLAAIVENANDAIIGRTLGGTITSWNTGAERLFGYTAAEAIGRNVNILIPPGHQSRFLQNQASIERGEAVPPYETQNLGKDGKLVAASLRLSPIKNGAGQIIGVSAILHDITARKQAEEARSRLAAIVENSNDAVIGRALDGTILSWNAAAERLFGYSAAEAIGQPITIILPPERQPAVAENSELLRRGQAVAPNEGERRARDGRMINTLASISPIKNEAGETIGAAVIIRDISERKRAEEQILKLNAELEQRVAERTQQLETVNKELEAFSYSVSHDLRAPLRGIDGFSQILLKKYADRLDEGGNDYLRRICRASTRMGELIDDLLQLSRISGSQIRIEAVDLSRLARSVLENLHENEPARKVVTEVQDGIEVSGDPRLLRIALENLLGNAWKFTTKKADARIRFGAKEQDGEQVAFIKDNGAGFNMRYAHKLFRAFQRLHGATEFEGTGIGLATVQRIVNLHGGRISANATVGKGATFYFAIPRANRHGMTTTPKERQLDR